VHPFLEMSACPAGVIKLNWRSLPLMIQLGVGCDMMDTVELPGAVRIFQFNIHITVAESYDLSTQ